MYTQRMVSHYGVSTVCHEKQDLQRNIILFGNLDIYNGPFQVYCIFVCLVKVYVPVNS